MATYGLRLRRALRLTPSIINHRNYTPTIISSRSLSQFLSSPQNPNPSSRFVHSRGFSTRTPMAGCDYKHWLITIDFPENPRLSEEEMVETYVQTAATVLGSREEAMKKIYACSTTTYTGFQIEVSEEVSKKFRGLPGVMFIVPDAYIDPVNKLYGGDKYENGKITHKQPRRGAQDRDVEPKTKTWILAYTEKSSFRESD